MLDYPAHRILPVVYRSAIVLFLVGWRVKKSRRSRPNNAAYSGFVVAGFFIVELV